MNRMIFFFGGYFHGGDPAQLPDYVFFFPFNHFVQKLFPCFKISIDCSSSQTGSPGYGLHGGVDGPFMGKNNPGYTKNSMTSGISQNK